MRWMMAQGAFLCPLLKRLLFQLLFLKEPTGLFVQSALCNNIAEKWLTHEGACDNIAEAHSPLCDKIRANGGSKMRRLYLTLPDELAVAIHEEAVMQGMTDTAFAEKVLSAAVKKVGFTSPSKVNLNDAVDLLAEEAEQRKPGKFTVYDLEAFDAYAVGQLKDGEVVSSTLRANIGKKFNERVRKKLVRGVHALDTHNKEGQLVAMKRGRNALYEKV